jgi:CRP/FNR family cyclic AMP-dependent transcriptional regulator
MPKVTEQLISFLRSVPIFGGLEGRSLKRIIAMMKEQTWKNGEILFSEGEPGRDFYLLVEGEVEILRTSGEAGGRRVPIVRLEPGETFGEMALVELQSRSATVVARKPSRTYSLNLVNLYNLYLEDNYAYVIVLQNMCRNLSRRLRKADGRIAEFLTAGKKGSLKAVASTAPVKKVKTGAKVAAKKSRAPARA